MNFEELQKAWQSQNPGATVTINTDLLLKEVRCNQHHFWMTIFWRDAREVGVAAFLTWLFFALGHPRPGMVVVSTVLLLLWRGPFHAGGSLAQRRKRARHE